MQDLKQHTTAETGEIKHYWWLNIGATDPSKPWSRFMCNRGQESRFPEGSTGLMVARWDQVTCPDCLAARRLVAHSETSSLPFSPLTGEGLSIQINDHASRVTYAVASHRHMDPVIRAEAALVLDMCRARRQRILAEFGRRSVA